MTTILESALEAARAAIAAALPDVAVELSEPEPEAVGETGYVAVLFGESVDREETFGQGLTLTHFSWIHAAEIEIQVAKNEGRVTRLAELREAVALAIEADPTLGGLVDRALLDGPSASHFSNDRSGVPLGVLSLPLILEYQSTSSAG